jgi:hypothetical protein
MQVSFKIPDWVFAVAGCVLLVASILSPVTRPILISCAICAGVVYGTIRFIAWWKPDAMADALRTLDKPRPIDEVVLTKNMVEIEKSIVQIYKEKPDDTYGDVNRRFLVAVNALGADEPVPTFYANGIANKMLYEYRRKFGHINYYSHYTLSGKDVMRRLTDEEKIAFRQLCIHGFQEKPVSSEA